MKHVIHTAHGIVEASLVAHITDVIPDLIVLVMLAHVVLLLFVAAEDPDLFEETGMEKTFEGNVAKRAGAAGDQENVGGS